jgi:hypothetical protein
MAIAGALGISAAMVTAMVIAMTAAAAVVIAAIVAVPGIVVRIVRDHARGDLAARVFAREG